MNYNQLFGPYAEYVYTKNRIPRFYCKREYTLKQALQQALARMNANRATLVVHVFHDDGHATLRRTDDGMHTTLHSDGTPPVSFMSPIGLWKEEMLPVLQNIDVVDLQVEARTSSTRKVKAIWYPLLHPL